MKWVVNCPECGYVFVSRRGPFGTFRGCSGYPKCTVIQDAPGVFSTKELREWRIRAHAAFDVVWRTGKMSRSEAYRWLREKMGLSAQLCHMKLMSIEQCKEVIRHVQEIAEAAVLVRE